MHTKEGRVMGCRKGGMMTGRAREGDGMQGGEDDETAYRRGG